MSREQDSNTTVGGFTSVGPRSRNEDRYLTVQMNLHGQTCSLIAVADGMGGEGCGDLAAQICIDELSTSFPALAATLCRHLDECKDAENENAIPSPLSQEVAALIGRMNSQCQVARTRLQEKATETPSGEVAGLKSTLVALLSLESHGLLFWLGDSPAFRFRDGRLTQLSKDHCVGVQVSRFIGPDATHDAEMRLETIEPGDVFVLCSDGISGYCSESELQNMSKFLLCRSHSPTDLAKGLVDFVRSTTKDNATAVVHAQSPIAWPPPLMKPLDRSTFHLRHVTRAVSQMCFEGGDAAGLRDLLSGGLTKELYYPGNYVCCQCGAPLKEARCDECNARNPESQGMPHSGPFIEIADGDTLAYIPVPEVVPNGNPPVDRILLGDEPAIDLYERLPTGFRGRTVRVILTGAASFAGEFLEIVAETRWVNVIKCPASADAALMLMPPKWKADRPLSLDKLFRGHVVRFKESVLRFLHTIPIRQGNDESSAKK